MALTGGSCCSPACLALGSKALLKCASPNYVDSVVSLSNTGLIGVQIYYDITILHTNDIHARIEQTNKYSGQCSKSAANNGKCFGGFARLKTKITELRGRNPNTLLLDGGDQFLGTLWFYKFEGAGIANFTNHLGYDAMTLGNHEFDNKDDGLAPFLDNVNFPVVSSNIRVPAGNLLHRKFAKSHVFTVGGEKIGVIGYTTKETPDISKPGPDLIFEDEIESVRQEVTSLTQRGVNKIIALGHAGFAVDKTIAENVEGIDVVIGGHDNTFLYTGKKPSNEDPQGTYPHVVTQSNGAKVLCVQDYAYGKYLGELRVTFNTKGDITSWGGNPVLLDNSVVQDPATLRFLEPYRQKVVHETMVVIGRAHVFLEGDNKVCRKRECNLGNVVADSLVKQNLRFSDSLYWNHVSIAFMNAGGIRASISKGDITIADVATVMPFSNTIDIVELEGRYILEALEHSARRVTEGNFGGFLQMSGMKVEYDIHSAVGRRVRRARVLCTECEVPEYEDIIRDKVYKVIMPSFMANGGDGYVAIRDHKIKHHLIGDLDLDVLISYLTDYSPITQAVEDRIVFVDNLGCASAVEAIDSISPVCVLVLTVASYSLSHLQM